MTLCISPVRSLPSSRRHQKRRFRYKNKLLSLDSSVIEVYADIFPWKEETVFLTNHLTLGASTVAAIYKERWQIEVFFKELKQNLKVKTFVGTSLNALRTQIWTALIPMLVLKYLQLKSQIAWSLSNLVAMLRWNLFTYRNLWEWIDRPYDTPPHVHWISVS